MVTSTIYYPFTTILLHDQTEVAKLLGPEVRSKLEDSVWEFKRNISHNEKEAYAKMQSRADDHYALNEKDFPPILAPILERLKSGKDLFNALNELDSIQDLNLLGDNVSIELLFRLRARLILKLIVPLDQNSSLLRRIYQLFNRVEREIKKEMQVRRIRWHKESNGLAARLYLAKSAILERMGETVQAYQALEEAPTFLSAYTKLVYGDLQREEEIWRESKERLIRSLLTHPLSCRERIKWLKELIHLDCFSSQMDRLASCLKLASLYSRFPWNQEMRRGLADSLLATGTLLQLAESDQLYLEPEHPDLTLLLTKSKVKIAYLDIALQILKTPPQEVDLSYVKALRRLPQDVRYSKLCARIHVEIGKLLHFHLNDRKKAVENYNKALLFLEKAPSHLLRARILTLKSLIHYYSSASDREEALGLAEEYKKNWLSSIPPKKDEAYLDLKLSLLEIYDKIGEEAIAYQLWEELIDLIEAKDLREQEEYFLEALKRVSQSSWRLHLIYRLFPRAEDVEAAASDPTKREKLIEKMSCLLVAYNEINSYSPNSPETFARLAIDFYALLSKREDYNTQTFQVTEMIQHNLQEEAIQHRSDLQWELYYQKMLLISQMLLYSPFVNEDGSITVVDKDKCKKSLEDLLQMLITLTPSSNKEKAYQAEAYLTLADSANMNQQHEQAQSFAQSGLCLINKSHPHLWKKLIYQLSTALTGIGDYAASYEQAHRGLTTLEQTGIEDKLRSNRGQAAKSFADRLFRDLNSLPDVEKADRLAKALHYLEGEVYPEKTHLFIQQARVAQRLDDRETAFIAAHKARYSNLNTPNTPSRTEKTEIERIQSEVGEDLLASAPEKLAHLLLFSFRKEGGTLEWIERCIQELKKRKGNERLKAELLLELGDIQSFANLAKSRTNYEEAFKLLPSSLEYVSLKQRISEKVAASFLKELQKLSERADRSEDREELESKIEQLKNEIQQSLMDNRKEELIDKYDSLLIKLRES